MVAEMDFVEPETAGPVVYVCAMHSEIIRDEAGVCPLCGMKLVPRAAEAWRASVPLQRTTMATRWPTASEWEDLMPEVNRTTNIANMRWKLVDRATDAENSAISWTFRTGDQVKIRLVNELQSDHPMHHPFHVHGERFLVLARDGVAEPNLVWKDTVLIRTGQTVDILMDASNPDWGWPTATSPSTWRPG